MKFNSKESESNSFSFSLPRIAVAIKSIFSFSHTFSIDQANVKILVATAYQMGDKSYPGLYLCNLNLMGCSFNNLALTNKTIISTNGVAVDLVIDNISAIPRILVVVANEINQKSELIRILRNYLD